MSTRWRQIQRFGWLAVFVVIAACKGSNLPRLPVRGSVTFDGAPVKHGIITFRPSSGSKGPSSGAAIAEGKFTIEVDKGPTAGPHDVEIKIASFANDTTKPDQPALEMRESLQFKSFSQHVDVSRENREFHFSLTPETASGRH